MTVKECLSCNKTFETLLADRCPECEAEFQAKELQQKKELLDERHKTVIKEMRLRKEFGYICNYCHGQFNDPDECRTHEIVCPKRPRSNFY